ncbi:MAG TPA: hypothetical protein VF365_10765, partial [Candidatus Limnocylindria bacterium]
MRHARPGAALAAVLILTACLPTPSTSPSASAAPSIAPTAPPSPSASASPSASLSPTATPAPSLSLDPPEGRDDRVVTVEVTPDVPADGDGTITVVITSAADTRIDELVLRWPTELAATLFLAPFRPSDDRVRDGGEPLVQPWTKWVIGPGERGEPAGTTSLGWGPLLAGATLEIPIVVTRRAQGPVGFDLQVLAGNDLLTL